MGFSLDFSFGGVWLPRTTEGCYGGRFGDMPLVLSLPAGKDYVIEGVQGGIALFSGFFFGFFPSWLQWVYG